MSAEKRIHDLRNALRGLSYFVDSLEGGYRFEDDLAAAKIAQLRKIEQLLQAEIPQWCDSIEKNGSAC